MKRARSTSILMIATLTFCSCSLVTVPVKVAGKVATTTVGVAGKAAGAGIDIVTPNKELDPVKDE